MRIRLALLAIKILTLALSQHRKIKGMTSFTKLPTPRMKDPFTKKLWAGFKEHLAPFLDDLMSPKSVATAKSDDMMAAMLPAILPAMMPQVPSLFEALDENEEFKQKIKDFVASLSETLKEEKELDDPEA